MDTSTERRASGSRGFGEFPLRALLLAAVPLCLVACSSRTVTSTSSFADRDPSATEVQTGMFKPGNVAGLDFASGSQTGVTDASGRFTCTTGKQVAFSIGNVELGDTVCATVAHPAALTASGSLMEPTSINVTRLLLMLDHDQVSDNGIQISAPLRGVASSWPAIDFSVADFEGELAAVISDIASVEGRANPVLPSGAEAFVYLDASLSCAYSGVFVNTFISGYFNTLTDAILRVLREPGSDADLFDMRIRRKSQQAQLYLQAEGTIELKALPTLINGPQRGIGSIAAEYRTPDLVDGSWDNAVAQQSIDRTGSFEVVRIGNALGDYRFTGTFSRTGDTGTPSFVGDVTLTLAGDTLTGEAFDLETGGAFTVSGKRLPGSNLIELTTTRAAEPSTAELLTDANDTPIGLQGVWPGLKGGSIDAVGCRLN
jgi:hypothetical protein